jgi:hypothetical protein
MERQQSLNLFVRVLALARKISEMPNGTARAILVLGSDPRKENLFAWMSDRDDFRKEPLRPLTVVVILLFETSRIARRLCVGGDHH